MAVSLGIRSGSDRMRSLRALDDGSIVRARVLSSTMLTSSCSIGCGDDCIFLLNQKGTAAFNTDKSGREAWSGECIVCRTAPAGCIHSVIAVTERIRQAGPDLRSVYAWQGAVSVCISFHKVWQPWMARLPKRSSGLPNYPLRVAILDARLANFPSGLATLAASVKYRTGV